MKKFLKMTLAFAAALLMITSCSDNSTGGTSGTAGANAGNGNSGTSGNSASSGNASAAKFDNTKEITVVTREEGSGTRSGFIEIVGIEVKNEDGTKTDRTTEEAITADKTDVMLTSVANDPYAIGYVSLGSINGTVKAVDYDGSEATLDNVKNGSYTLQRPFNIAYKGELSGLAKDFVDFIMSEEGQEVIKTAKYVKIDENAASFAGTKPAGKINVSGSSSVTPVMEKLAEAYKAINPSAEVIITQSDSGTGIKDAIGGTSEIGMVSRALKDTETAELNWKSIALDGIGVIVNPSNTTAALTKDQVTKIFIGEITKWNELG